MKNAKWKMNEKEKKRFIAALAGELVSLRSKAGISQGELAAVLGVSRQTYGSIERGDRHMTWNMFLSLILFFDYDKQTHPELRKLGISPREVFSRFGGGASMTESIGIDAVIEGAAGFTDKLDAQAMQNLRTVLILEYARCTKTPGEAIIRAFDGVKFVPCAERDADEAANKPKKRRGRPPKKH